MRAVSAKVVRGKVVTRAKLPEGAKLTVFVHEAEPAIALDAEDERAIARNAADIKAGKYVTATNLRAYLRRP
jgi:hypothetical protein